MAATTHTIPTGRSIFRDTRPSIGVGISELRGPSLVPTLAAAGVDYVLVDMEHSSLSFRDVAVTVSAGRAVGLPVFVRPPELTRSAIVRSMDLGADGLLLQRVGSAAEASAAVDHMKYPPQGHRGDNGSIFAASPHSQKAADEINRETVLLVIIETLEGLSNIEEICSTPGVDGVWIGHADLSLALGVPGQLGDSAYTNAVETILAACRAHNVPYTIGAAGTSAVALEQATLGCFTVFFDDELGILKRAASEFVAAVHAFSNAQTTR
jgi:2-dehydro-3-deoxyglucarate aldolase/4-hydroxy-2-oxoheptanedioate aldolase